MTSPHPLAAAQWQSKDDCIALAEMWEHDEAKREAEKIVGNLATELGDTHTVVDLGCGNGRMVGALPDFRSYRGYDTSPYLIDLAIERYHINKRCRFEQRDLFAPWPYRTPVDILICVHVARHYPEPLVVLQRALEWPAWGYILSALHGPEHVDLLNGVCLSTAELDEFMATTESIPVGVVEQGDPGGMQVRYWSMRRDRER